MAKWWLLLALMSMPTLAAIDAYEFPDAELAARHEALIEKLRCPNCLNTNLAGSDAMIAQDLRREVHRLLLEGKTDDEVLAFMQRRYGDFILYEPPLKTGTLLLWFGPFLLLTGIAIIFVAFVRGRTAAPSSLSPEEEQRLNQLLSQGDRPDAPEADKLVS